MVDETLSTEDEQAIRRRIEAIPVFAALGFRDIELSPGQASARAA